MASLIMAVTVLPWVVLTVPGWAAVQAMAGPVHTAVVPVAATVAPVPTAVPVVAAQGTAVPVGGQAMVALVLTVVPAAVAQAMAVPVLTAGARARTSRIRAARVHPFGRISCSST